MKVERSIEIAAPPEAVYDLVMDPSRLRSGSPSITSRDAPSGTAEAGYSLTQCLRLAGRRFKVRWTVSENDPWKRVVWDGPRPVGPA